MRLNRIEQKEMLEEIAQELLYALYHSQPVGRDELSAVYLAEGALNGMCRVFQIHYEVKLRRQIIFYKGAFVGEGKYWFEVVNEEFSEEDATYRIANMRKELDEINRMRRGAGL